MSATNKTHLSTAAAKVYVTAVDGSVPALLDDMSNAAAVMTAVDALTLTRIASVTDVNFATSVTEQVKTDTDDNGTIFSAYLPQSRITGNWYETMNSDALGVILGLSDLDLTSPDAKAFGQNLTTKELPQLIVKLEGMPDATGKKKYLYLIDAGLNGEIVFSFLDVVRNSGLAASAFEFISNRGGAWIAKVEE